jgi:hypothetical protein
MRVSGGILILMPYYVVELVNLDLNLFILSKNAPSFKKKWIWLGKKVD